MVSSDSSTSAAHRREAGYSLAELLVVMALIALIVPLAGAFLRDTVQTQDRVQSMTNGSTTAEVVVASLESGLRNAAGVLPKPVTTVGDQLLVARVRDVTLETTGWTSEGDKWTCQAWFYKFADKTLYTRKVPAPPPADWTLPPSDEALATSWASLANRVVVAQGGAPMFAPMSTGGGIDVAFSVIETAPSRKRADPNITMRTSIVPRPQLSTGVGPCVSPTP